MKRVLWIFIAALALGSSRAYAYDTVYETEKGSNSCCPWWEPCALSFTGEFLYWKPLGGGMEYALPMETTPIPGKTSPYYTSFKSAPGFRVGGQYIPFCSAWDLSFTAAHLCTSASESVSGRLFPLLALQSGVQDPGNPFSYAETATSASGVNYWVFDFRIATLLPFCDNRFSLIPYYGLRGALIEERAKVVYGNVHEATLPLKTITVSTKNRCNNVGIQGGLRGEWPIGCGFRLAGDFAAALTYGWFHVKEVQGGQTGLSNTVNFSSTFSQIVPAIDGWLGFSWGREVECWAVNHVELLLGYQVQYWWRVNQLPRFVDSAYPYYLSNSQDLGFQGLTLGARLDF